MEQACLMNEDVSDKSTRTSCYLCWNHCWLQYYMLLSLSCFCFYSSLLFHFSFVWKWHNVKQKERERNKMKHIMPISIFTIPSATYFLYCPIQTWKIIGKLKEEIYTLFCWTTKKKKIFELHLWMIQIPPCCIYKVERLVCGLSVADS